MKLTRAISLFSMIVFFSINLYSQDINSSKKSRLLIYNFVTTDNYDNVKEKEKNYQYYSIVIPETISKNLNNTGKYEILREAGPFSIDSDFNDKNEKSKYIKKIGELGFQNKSDYIITGTFNVVDSKLHIRVTIFDVIGKVIEVVEHESSETGVQLQGTTDIISDLINEKVITLSTINLEKLSRSPFIALYNSLNIITLGIDSGYVYIFGKWSSLYNNSLYAAPFIDFDLVNDFSMSLKFTSIQSDSGNTNTGSYSQIRILSSSLNIIYFYPFGTNYGVALSGGGGVTKTTITIQPNKPFGNPLSEKMSIDPNIDISAYFAYNLSTFNFKTGILYKKILFKDQPMDMAIIFAGAGIKF